MTHPLRPYQAELIASAREQYRQGHRSILIVLPTGGGKTRVGSEFVRGAVAKGGRVLWLAHRRELIAQAHGRLVADGCGRVGVVAASLPQLTDHGAPVQVASLQTLASRGQLPEASLVVFDEAHHYVASEWHEVARKYAHATRLGLTATPQRSDGVGLGDLFTSLVVGATIPELTEQGFLVKCEVQAPDKFLRGHLAKTPAEAWVQAGRPRSVVFCRSLAHSEEVITELRAVGARAADIDGSTPSELRESRLKAFHKGELDVIVNVFVLTEGWDCPAAECCILARPTKSPSVFLQMVGRVLRPAEGKKRALLLDLPGCTWLPEIGLPDDEREYSLDGTGIKKPVEKSPIRQCNSCGLVSRAGASVCQHCGAAWPVDPTLIPQVDGRDLLLRSQLAAAARHSAATGRDEKIKYLREQQAIATVRGYKPHWASWQFKKKFGSFPWELRIK